MEKLVLFLVVMVLGFGGFVRCIWNVARPPQSRRRRTELLYAFLFLCIALVDLALVATSGMLQ
jgi:hypothetical protein